jgi:hypothetical protein
MYLTARSSNVRDLVRPSIGAADEDDRTTAKIKSFRELEPGWHYHEGGPPSAATVARAIYLHRLMRLLGFAETDAFPGTEGEILLAAYLGDHCVEILVETEGKVSITHEKSEKILAEFDNVTQPIEVLLKIMGEIWRQSVSFTFGITMLREGGLINSTLETPPTGPELRSFNSNVLRIGGPPFVNTSESFMQIRPGSHPYSGNLRPEYFPQATT